jgi:hypothetical protein
VLRTWPGSFTSYVHEYEYSCVPDVSSFAPPVPCRSLAVTAAVDADPLADNLKAQLSFVAYRLAAARTQPEQVSSLLAHLISSHLISIDDIWSVVLVEWLAARDGMPPP